MRDSHRIATGRRIARRLPAACVVVALLACAPGAFAADDTARTSIYGGSVDTRGDVGWIAAVMHHPRVHPGNGFERQFCAGSLVAARWVLTAAHCVVDENGRVRGAETLQVLIGQKNLNADPAAEGRPIDVAEVHLDPAYRPPRWDAALLELVEPSTQLPIPIVGRLERRLWDSGSRAYIAGWGDRRPASDPRTDFPVELHSGFIRIRRDRSCDRIPGVYVNRAMVCAGNRSGRPDTCIGDSGGPLAVRARSGWRLAGVTSFGRCGNRNEFGAYTQIAGRVRRWVEATQLQNP